MSPAGAQWPAIAGRRWRSASLSTYIDKVPHYLPYYKAGAMIREEWQAQHPGQSHPSYDPGGMITNLFLKPPHWRAPEGYGEPKLGSPP